MKEELEELVDQYLTGTISAEGKERLKEMLDSPEFNALLEDSFVQGKYNGEENIQLKNEVQNWLAGKIKKQGMGKVIRLLRVAAAAMVFLVFGLWFLENQNSKVKIKKEIDAHDVKAPQSNKGVIILADGKKISIDSLTRIDQAAVKITKTSDGKIIYSGTASGLAYNTLSNPRGSKVIDMTLSDGSHVWLNAGSSITYPVGFVGNERNVRMTGEAYFEVAPPRPPKGGVNQPPQGGVKPSFKVMANDVMIEDLGTEFNVNSFEETKTTLVNGVVRIGSTVLKQGEQAVNEKFNGKVDVEEVTAWKNGKFQFKDASIETMMKEVCRWYDTEVVFESKIPGNFVAEISRDVPVSKLLHILELTNRVRFKIEGKKIIVIAN